MKGMHASEYILSVRRVAPSSPEIKSFTNRSITLVWTHNAARAHRPILRFSVSVRTVSDNTRSEKRNRKKTPNFHIVSDL